MLQRIREAVGRTHASTPWEALAFATVLAAAFGLRIARLGTIPRVITGDEAENLQTAYKIIEGTGGGFFGFDWKPQPIFSLYPLAWTVRIFGDSVADFRLFPVILSLLTIALFYVLARQSMRAPAALGAMALLATNLWFLHFSRTAWDNMNAPLFALGACWATTRALKTEKLWWWTVVGAFVAAGLYGYFAGRFIFVSVGLITAAAVVLRQARWRRGAIGLAIAAVLSALLFAPMARNIVDDWDHFTSRTDNVSVFHKQPGEAHAPGWRAAGANLKHNVEGFIFQDTRWMHEGPQWARYTAAGRAPLDPLAGNLFVAGLIVAAARWRDTYAWWPFFAPLFLAEIFSRGTPDLARGLIFAPFFFLFIGILFDEALRRAREPRIQRAALAACIALVAWIGVTNVRDYFRWQTDDMAQAVRMPGLDTCEFEVWSQAAKDAASRGVLLSFGEFERRTNARDCSALLKRIIIAPDFDRPGAMPNTATRVAIATLTPIPPITRIAIPALTLTPVTTPPPSSGP